MVLSVLVRIIVTVPGHLALVRLQYCVQVWALQFEKDAAKLQHVLRRAAKIRQTSPLSVDLTQVKPARVREESGPVCSTNGPRRLPDASEGKGDQGNPMDRKECARHKDAPSGALAKVGQGGDEQTKYSTRGSM